MGGVRASIIRLAGGRTKPNRSRDEDRKSHAMRDCSTAHEHPDSAGLLGRRRQEVGWVGLGWVGLIWVGLGWVGWGGVRLG